MDATDGKSYPATIIEVITTYKVKFDNSNSERILTREQFKVLINDKPKPFIQVEDADGTFPANREVITCPVQQPKVKNGATPNIELFKKLIQCSYGEKPARKGMDVYTDQS